MIRSFGLEARLAVLEDDGKGAVIGVDAAAIGAERSGGGRCVVAQSEIEILILINGLVSP